jgi:hypothetical protein
MAHTINLHVAGRLEEAARLLRNQGSDPYRVRAYRRAATVVRGWALPVDEVFRRQGLAGLKALPAVGPTIARAIRDLRKAWLPILHAVRDHRQYTALYSNTAHAHRAGKTHDWVVLYSKDAAGERSHTVLTATHGLLRGNRVVAGREGECEAFYAARAA